MPVTKLREVVCVVTSTYLWIVEYVLLTSGFQISGELAYDTLYIEGRFLRFQVSCPGRLLGCLPFKIQGREANVPGIDCKE